MTGTRISDMDLTTDIEGATAPVIVGGVNYRAALGTLRGYASVRDHGAVGDCTGPNAGTDDYAAFAAAIAALGINGGMVFVPEGHYRLSQKLVISSGVHLVGEGYRENPGIVAGVSYSYPMFYAGSVLVFDTGVGGIQLLEFTDESSVTTVLGQGNEKYEFWSARHSIVEKLAVVSSGNSATAAGMYGIESRTRFHLRDMFVTGFGDDAVRITASSDVDDGNTYGNASHTTLFNVKCVNNAGDGFYIAGRDTSNITLICCDAIVNDGWGFNDEGLFGNIYVGCQAATNALGSFRATAATGANVYLGCYIETGTGSTTSLTAACTVLGGNMGSSTFHPSDSPAFVLGAGQSHRRAVQGINYRGDTDVSFGLGQATASGTQNTAAWFGSTVGSATMDSYKLSYVSASSVWQLQYANSASATVIEWPGANASLRAFASAFPNGFFIGGADMGHRQRFASVTAEPSSGTWVRGDIAFNRTPSAAGKIGWVCITTGTEGTLNSGNTTGGITSGTDDLVVNSATGLSVGVYITIAGVSGVKLVTAVDGTAITIDSNADATVAAAAVAYSAAAFKEWGVIDT